MGVEWQGSDVQHGVTCISSPVSPKPWSSMVVQEDASVSLPPPVLQAMPEAAESKLVHHEEPDEISKMGTEGQ